jgi:serine protease Do
MTTLSSLPLPLSDSVDSAGSALARQLRRSLLAVYDHGGAGSGIPWGPGLALTNSHVVRGGEARIGLADGTLADAEVVATDTASDLALLRTSAALPPPLVMRGTPLHIGELVYAIGNPWGEQGVLTAGIVLAPGYLREDGAFAPIRADLRLAPGNSGGPMTDAEGRLVGINSMIIGGAAVAIPVAVIQRFVAAATRAAPAGYDR